jgi:hypothetical protein
VGAPEREREGRVGVGIMLLFVVVGGVQISVESIADGEASG